MSEKTGIAVIGSGMWGKNHVRTWNELGNLVAICDPDSERLSAMQKLYPGVDLINNSDEVLTSPDIAAVVIASPAPTHYALTLAALDAGKDVLVEKPMALTVDEGRDLVSKSEQLGKILMVGHVLEYHPAITKLRSLLDSGELGKIRYIYSNRLNLGRIRTEENALWSFAPHDIAIILRVLGRLPDDVACHGAGYLNQAVADVTLTNLSFSQGVESHIYVSWLHPFKEQRFVVVGDQQMAVFDDTLPWNEKLRLYPHRIDWVGGKIPVAQKAEVVAVELKESEPLKEECKHFLHSVESRERALSDAKSGLEVLQVLDAAQRSLDRGGVPISLREESMRSA